MPPRARRSSLPSRPPRPASSRAGCLAACADILHPAARQSGASSEQALDRAPGLVVRALSDVAVDELAAAIDEIDGGPVAVAPGVPGRELVVLSDGEADAVATDGLLHVLRVVLFGELRRVHADDGEAALPV